MCLSGPLLYLGFSGLASPLPPLLSPAKCPPLPSPARLLSNVTRIRPSHVCLHLSGCPMTSEHFPREPAFSIYTISEPFPIPPHKKLLSVSHHLPVKAPSPFLSLFQLFRPCPTFSTLSPIHIPFLIESSGTMRLSSPSLPSSPPLSYSCKITAPTSPLMKFSSKLGKCLLPQNPPTFTTMMSPQT